jgi:hypothetical protein
LYIFFLDKRLSPDFKLIKPLTVRVQHHAGDASLQIRTVWLALETYLQFDRVLSGTGDAGNSDPGKLKEEAADVQKLSEDELLKRRVEIKVRLLLQNFSSEFTGFVLFLTHYLETCVANDLCCFHHILRNLLLLTSSVWLRHMHKTFLANISC